MSKYRVVYTVTETKEQNIQANSIDEAREKWESQGLDAELFFIEDEDGNQEIFD